jgi:hypothetical protein
MGVQHDRIPVWAYVFIGAGLALTFSKLATNAAKRLELDRQLTPGMRSDAAALDAAFDASSRRSVLRSRRAGPSAVLSSA